MDEARFRDDAKLSPNFSLYELTVTLNSGLQQQNRTLTDAQVSKLGALAGLLETCRQSLGLPMRVHSGYRCLELNGATPGSSTTSQHMLCEAADWSPIPGSPANIKAAFDQMWALAKGGKLKVGQLMFETAKRDYGTDVWVHISLGAPYRAIEKCGEIKIVTDGVYHLVDKIV